ncbi:perilipin 6 isoform X3 [Syngnathus scovelli]|uniref:perilipin 6 isoform X3 n=1 Tax=Syngnathus scovelli TaxID=161590 RepID=UPI00211010CF|nr:perilipin 6 isoform X1 [Syngnathus scovelli]
MGFGERDDMSVRHNHEMSVVLRLSHLPLVRSALSSVTFAYSEVKGRYPLLGLVGNAAEAGVRNASVVALSGATPLVQTLWPQIEAANSFALVGLDQLERKFPVLNRSTDEVVGHLKDAFFLTLDDMQLWMLDGLEQMERLSQTARAAVRQLQDSQVGRAASSGLDDVLSRLESAAAYYMPLPPTLRREWEMRVQAYEDEDDSDEPGPWTRVRSLLLSISLQLYHRMFKVREQLEDATGALGDTVRAVGLAAILDLLGELLWNLRSLLVALVYRAESLRETSLGHVRKQAVALAELRPVRQVRELPLQVRRLLGDLQELSKILLQLVINATPLYDLLQRPSDKEVEDFLNQEDLCADSSSRRSSANSLFLKAMDGRPRRRKSLYSRAARSPGPDPPAASGRRSSLKQEPEADGSSMPSDGAARRPSAAELILTPLKQFVSQSQKAFEYLNPNSAEEAINSASD